MAPSRGVSVTNKHSASPSSNTNEDEIAVTQQTSSALVNAKRNFKYLINPTSSSAVGAVERPARLRTRALLRTIRYISQFIIWRLVRWAKYAAVGFAVAAVGTTVFGTVVSGAGFILAPTSIGGSIVAASIWGVGKYIARKAHNRWKSTGGDKGQADRERAEHSPIMRTGTLGQELGPQAIPW